MLARYRAIVVVSIFVVGCGEVDSCLDRGGSWSEEFSVCEFHSGPIQDPDLAVSVGLQTLSFAFGPAIRDQAPFVGTLNDGVWHVHGSLPEGHFGGVAEVWLDAESGRVVRVLHGQ